MICCDQCEEWYHGSCVGISVSQGKRMEREGNDYTCPICMEKDRQVREQRELSRWGVGDSLHRVLAIHAHVQTSYT